MFNTTTQQNCLLWSTHRLLIHVGTHSLVSPYASSAWTKVAQHPHQLPWPMAPESKFTQPTPGHTLKLWGMILIRNSEVI